MNVAHGYSEMIPSEEFTLEHRRLYLSLVFSELSLLIGDTTLSRDEAGDAARVLLRKISESLSATCIILYEDPSSETGAPLAIFYPSASSEEQRPPSEIFAHALGTQGSLVDQLENHKEIRDWASRKFGIANGMIIAYDPRGYIPGCLICGRAEGFPLFTHDEKEFLRRSASVLMDSERARSIQFNEKEISLKLQQALVSEVPEIPGFVIDVYAQSATANSLVGGDFFDIFEAPGDQLYILFGDISGKGVDVAYLSFLIKNLLAGYSISQIASPARSVQALNTILAATPHIDSFASLVLMCLDKRTGEARYCCAGHLPTCHMTRAGEHRLLTSRSPLVGALPNMSFENAEINLGHGDVLFFYTDGATEARSPQKDFFGEEQVARLFAKEVSKGFDGVTARIFNEIENFCGKNLSDDITLLAVRYD